MQNYHEKLEEPSNKSDKNENKDVLVGFQEDYPGVLNGDNLVDILKSARAKKQRYVCPVPEGMEIPKN